MSTEQIVLTQDPVWTQPGSFWRMPTMAPRLVKDLQDSELVIFKGDLNYRKLTEDVCLCLSLWLFATCIESK
jgi:hypothetical protein